MASAQTLLRTTVAAGSSVVLLFSSAPAQAQPAPTLPIDAQQAPGLPAMESLGPVIQQAAADPNNAASMLMAAAAAFVGDTAAPTPSRDVASAVNSFVADPAAHVPAPGAGPGLEAHIPAGINPAYAVGPAPEAATPLEMPHMPAAATMPGPPGPAPAPAAAPVPAAPEAVPGAPAPVAVQSAPAPAPAPGAAPAGTPGPPGFAPDSPPTQDFMYPSISNGCLKDGGNVLATAISVAGPAKIPLPGPGPGQTAYVFTAVGTPGPAAEQKLPLNVTWVNLTTGKSGSATLKPRSDINPDGPTTLTAIVDTGSGSIMSTIFGQVTTTEKQCQFMPTIGSTVVP
ncbi:MULTISPECIES: hypothetical protein [Mycobacteriaceae]|uniref:Rv1157c family protein n=1 Tax=Mycobacteriaceae TaxID=1762 RepID=UPI0007FEC692|nr:MULTISPECIES: hypothetical protein [Mycobacteriaceae]MCK0173060.1 hypothetical protein [Mycolicibacterium sp. F2034L]OBB57973.1 hypothetical protein A5757_19355 [Mycobacterium sp. 852013-51886_SCH5428379]